jgi:periplasmic protein TonB
MWGIVSLSAKFPISLNVPTGKRGEYLGNEHFLAVLLLSLLLHVAALLGYYLVPKAKVIDIPVRALNIRLGDGEAQLQEGQAQPQPSVPNTAAVEANMSKLTRDTTQEKAAPKPQPKPPETKPVAKQEPAPDAMAVPKSPQAPRQYVRSTPAPSSRSAEATLGNSTASNAEIKSRYEQAISLWIEKFKVYPADARMQGLQGSTVIRIRIDRRGTIRYSALEGSTGYIELDRAALDMVRRANPVPAVPNDYPAGDMFEFLIPVNFHIE